ncbi:hypothetical protein F4860DRAFT_346831 [Xylaria cubensis]|nr:hypothetical protein F4860DRAFT_346831 [Xylaria cubensis]
MVARYSRPITRAFVETNVKAEFLGSSDNWADDCDSRLEICEEALLEPGDDPDLSCDSETDSDVATEVIDEAESQDPDDLAFDNGYFDRDSDDDSDGIMWVGGHPRSRRYQIHVEQRRNKEEEKRYDEETTVSDALSEKLLKLLSGVDDESSAPYPVSMDKLDQKTAKMRRLCESNDDSDASFTQAKSAAESPQLQPKALQRVIDFFQGNPHVKRKACEDFCVQAYRDTVSRSYKASPCEVGPDWKRPSGVLRQVGVSAYPSEFQFPGSYMVEIEVVEDSPPGLEIGVERTRMTLFYFTFEELAQTQIDAARSVYGDFVPEYTYAGHMGLAPEHPELFVWRIDCPAGSPFSTDAGYFGLRRNCKKYANILRHFVDFVVAPLGSEGGSSINTQNWPTVLHNPRIDADNIIVRSDFSGIVGLLLWTTPPAVRLPFGASLLGLVFLEGTPLQVEDATEGSEDGNKPARKASARAIVDNFPVKSYSRDVYDLESLMLRYLQQKVPAFAQDPKLMKHIFAAMAQGVEVADVTDRDKEYYKHQVDRMSWDWFHFPPSLGISD